MVVGGHNGTLAARRTLAALATCAALLLVWAAPAGAAPGDLLVPDQDAFGANTGGLIRVDPATGARTTVSENSSPPGGPSFSNPLGIALAANGSILVADENAFGGTGGVIRVDPVTGARTAVSENSAPLGGPSFEDPAEIAIEFEPLTTPPPTAAPPTGPCANVIVGDSKGNNLQGTDGGDTVKGLGGNDKIKAGNGDDCVRGGPGHDKVEGGEGNDQVNGGQKRDVLEGGPGDDLLKAIAGRVDVINCGPGEDTVRAEKKDIVNKDCETVKG